MKNLLRPLAAIVFVTFIVTAGAIAAPTSKCNDNGEGSFVCELSEEDSNGNPTEIGWLVPLSASVGTGAILILDPGGAWAIKPLGAMN